MELIKWVLAKMEVTEYLQYLGNNITWESTEQERETIIQELISILEDIKQYTDTEQGEKEFTTADNLIWTLTHWDIWEDGEDLSSQIKSDLELVR